MKKFGFSMELFTHSQITNQINYLAVDIKKQKEQCDLVIFTRQQMFPKDIPPCAILSQKEMWGYDGTVIATDFKSAQDLLFSPLPKNKYFYLLDLEWIYMNNNYSDIAKIYLSDELDLIVRSQTHYNIVSQMWKKPKYVIQNFTYKNLISL